MFAYKAWIAGEEQARAAMDQAAVAQRAFVAAESSAVYFGVIHAVTLPRPNGSLAQNIQITMGNSGESETRELVVFAACTTTKRGARNPFNIEVLGNSKRNHLTLAPKEVVTPVACFHTESELALINKKRMSVYVMAEAVYRDTMNPSLFHHVEFCDRLHDFTKFGMVSISDQCNHHNCTDTDCTDQPGSFRLMRETPQY